MERAIHRLLVTWVVLLGATLLAQYSGWLRLAYWLLVLVALGLPLVVAALLGRVVLGLRKAWWRLWLLRRATKWRRPRPTPPWLLE